MKRRTMVERALEELREDFEKKVVAYATEYRMLVLLPLCRMKKLEFVSGNGDWTFLKNDRPVKAYEQGFKYLQRYEDTLCAEVLGHHLFGHYMQDILKKDYE